MSHLVCADAFTHRFQKNLRKGYKVSIPVLSEVSASDVTPGTEPTPQDAGGTAVSITIDNWKEATIDASPLTEVEDGGLYLQNAAKAIAYTIDKAVDISVAQLFEDLASSSVYGSDGQTFSDEIFIALVETLDTNDVPDEGRFLIGDPSMRADMLKIDKFVRQDYINGAPTSNGKFGLIYNSEVRITNNLDPTGTTGNYGVYSHPDAIGVVMQLGPNVKYWDLGWKFHHLIVADCAWGADEIRDTFGKAFYTRSA
jgi:hypothetical protein